MHNLTKHLANYLALRRSLGYKLEQDERLLRSFTTYLEEKSEPTITAAIAMEWALFPKNVRPSHWSKRLSVVRLFAQYLITFVPETEVPDKSLLYAKTQRTEPYLYTDKQVKQILDACLKEKSKGLRHLTYYTLFGLLVVTGCRIREIVNLTVNNVNLETGIITIRGSKFGKSRNLPIGPSTNDKLIAYSSRRDAFPRQPGIDNYFLSEQGRPLTVNGVETFYVRLSKKIGLRHKTDSFGPRIHDFRHSYAIKTIIKWYRSNADVHQLMPLLATYLGHKKPSDTYWYLTNVPELMALAAERFELSGELL